MREERWLVERCVWASVRVRAVAHVQLLEQLRVCNVTNTALKRVDIQGILDRVMQALTFLAISDNNHPDEVPIQPPTNSLQNSPH